MSAKNYLLNMLLVGSSIVMLSSCEKNDVYDPSNAKKTTDVVILDGFDWATTRNVTISMQSPVATSASIYLDKDCNQLVAEFPVKEGKSNATFELPISNTSIWMKYPLKSGGDEVAELQIHQSDATRVGSSEWIANKLFPDYATTPAYNPTLGKSIAYQPSEGKYGTIMFEDNWPNLGDYDFNDFVVNYQIKAQDNPHFTDGMGGNYDYNREVTVFVSLKLRAMGGSFPYRFCMQLGKGAHGEGGTAGTGTIFDVKRADVTIQDVNITPSLGGADVKLIEGTEYPIIALEGFRELTKKTGGSFYNTEQNHLISHDQTTVVTFTIVVNTSNIASDASAVLKGIGSQFAFDYFLQREDNGQEIHILGYAPSELYGNYEADLKGQQTKNYYCNDKGFVWALKVPQEIPWATEKKDIKFVYNKFADWLTMGGYIFEPNLPNSVPLRWYDWTVKDGRFTEDTNLYVNPNEH